MHISELLYDLFSRFMFDKRLITFVFSFVPLFELRAALPLGVAIGLEPWKAFIYAYLGSFAACPITLGLFKPTLSYLKTIPRFKAKADSIENAINEKAKKLGDRALSKKGGVDFKVKRIKMILSALFVALPLPMTGVWTGTAVAAALGLNNRCVLFAIATGDLIAALIVAFLVFALSEYIDAVLMAIAVLCVLGVVGFLLKALIKRRKREV